MGDGQLIASPADVGTALKREFFDRPVHEVAPDLLGRVIAHGAVAVRMTEVEAYGLPGEDPASHTYRGRTPRNAVMFGHPGHLYVYFTYGMHFCANLVCMPDGVGSAVLLRAGEVIAGSDLVRTRRLPAGGSAADGAGERPARVIPERDLARGPARLAVALGLSREHNGLDCCSPGPLQVFEGTPVDQQKIRTGPRTGVSTGVDTPWRFWIDGDSTVSPYRPHVRRRRS
jgi:DNA-3-methyladenine glycosylase